VFDLAERYVEQRLELDPYGATFLGAPGFDDRCTDLSPAAAVKRADLDREFLADLDRLPPTADDAERVAIDVIRERVEARLVQFEAGEHLRDIGVLWSSAHLPRMVLDLMSREDDEAWSNIASRLEGTSLALAGCRESLERGRSRELFAARRQAVGVARTFAIWAGLEGETEGADPGVPWFSTFVAEYTGADPDLVLRLTNSAAVATSAYAQMSTYLRDDYAPAAPVRDAVGAERYAALARYWTGADLDLVETYEWGWAEVGRIGARMATVCEQILPGLTKAPRT
jgi:uncharacterized protein (DUF885 family)